LADEVRIKKVKAYPFAVTLKHPAGAVQGQIVKLAQTGFLAETASTAFKTGEKVECSFELPVLHKWVNEICVVVKLYTQWAGGAGGGTQSAPTAAVSQQTPPPGQPPPPKTVALVEFHFQGLSLEHRENVTAFLNAATKTK